MRATAGAYPIRQRLTLTVAVAAGSALGALCRWAVGLAVLGMTPTVPAAGGWSLPWATLVVNVGGSVLIGWLARATEPHGRWPLGPVGRQFLMTGFCGGLTTFSIFSLEAWHLAAQWSVPALLAYLAVSVVLWLVGCAVGMRLAGRMEPEGTLRSP